MSFTKEKLGDSYRNPPISNIAVNKNTVTFKNASGKQKVKLSSSTQRTDFIEWLLS